MDELILEGDREALYAVEAIVAEELEHREAGMAEGRDGFVYKFLGVIVAAATSLVIWLGMRL